MAEWSVPTNVKQLRAFLGFAGYYKRFVSEFSRIAKPLTDMLGGTSRRTSNNKCTTRQLPEWHWGATQDFAFQTIKKHITSPPKLAYADYSLPFLLPTYASVDGLGAVLCQVQDNKERVIAYASRSLLPSEKNYPAHKLEFLALKWAVTDIFYDYLYGYNFSVLTDNNPMTYVLTSAKLDATGHRWLAALAAFDFDIKYSCYNQ